MEQEHNTKQNSFSKVKGHNDFLTQTKDEAIHYHKICLTKTEKKSSSLNGRTVKQRENRELVCKSKYIDRNEIL